MRRLYHILILAAATVLPVSAITVEQLDSMGRAALAESAADSTTTRAIPHSQLEEDIENLKEAYVNASTTYDFEIQQLRDRDAMLTAWLTALCVAAAALVLAVLYLLKRVITFDDRVLDAENSIDVKMQALARQVTRPSREARATLTRAQQELTDYVNGINNRVVNIEARLNEPKK